MEQNEHDLNTKKAAEPQKNAPVPDEEKTPQGEDALELHYMSVRERAAYKRAKYRKETDDMSFRQKAGFFFDYYKWHTIISLVVVFCAIFIGRSVYLNTRPMALGLIILNNEESEDISLSAVIEDDYRSYYTFDKNDRFVIMSGLSVDPVNYEQEVIAAGSTGLSDYETLFYQTSAGSIDAVLSDYDGVSYCVEQDLVYPIDMLFSDEALDAYKDRLIVMTSYTGDERDYAIDVSDSTYLAQLGLGYEACYIMFPTNISENNERAMQFISFLLQN